MIVTGCMVINQYSSAMFFFYRVSENSLLQSAHFGLCANTLWHV